MALPTEFNRRSPHQRIAVNCGHAPSLHHEDLAWLRHRVTVVGDYR